jgi:polysaccharide export outer membrane protein
MDSDRDRRGWRFAMVSRLIALALLLAAAAPAVFGQSGPAPTSVAPAAATVTDYVIGPQDVLMITSYDQADLTGKFTVEADGTFTYPMIGRIKAGGVTQRAFETQLKKRLVDEGYFRNPQITVAVEQYKSQKIFIMGEVRQGGPYPLSGDMNLVEALARAGTMPSASGEVIIVHAGANAVGPTLPGAATDTNNIVRVELRDLQNGVLSQNAALRDGDTIYLPRAETIYVYGEVKNPNAYSLPQKNTTVQQALSLAGGPTNRAAVGRIKIVRTINGQSREISAKLTDVVKPGDTITVPERFL